MKTKTVLTSLLVATLVSVLAAGALASQEDLFLKYLWESNNDYQIGKYLEAKVALMRATSALDLALSEALEQGNITFEKFRSVFDGFTDVQFKQLRGELVGKKVTWSGYVDDVKEKWFSGFAVQVDMDPPETFLSVYEVTLAVGSDMEDFVGTLTKGKQIKFRGRITSIRKLLGKLIINIEDVTFLD